GGSCPPCSGSGTCTADIGIVTLNTLCWARDSYPHFEQIEINTSCSYDRIRVMDWDAGAFVKSVPTLSEISDIVIDFYYFSSPPPFPDTRTFRIYVEVEDDDFSSGHRPIGFKDVTFTFYNGEFADAG